MRVAVVTKEYPPQVYGGAGVHVEFLIRELRARPDVDVDVYCFGARRSEAGTRSFSVPAGLADANPAVQTLAVDVEIAAALVDADVIHSHTWYANFAGVVGGLLHGAPHVLTAHSLEPSRPWKAEQLGGGYQLSSWVEREAYAGAAAIVAVSAGMRAEILSAYPFVDPASVHVIYNGIDTTLYRPVEDASISARYGIDTSRPFVLFVGRITRQKGVDHLLAAARRFHPDIQLVFCAGAPDTPDIAAQTAAAVTELSDNRGGVMWIREHLPRPEVVALMSQATVFVCPSVYEPLGIVNLEAMACGTAVVASDVGGIPEVVANGVTGILVPYDADDPTAFRYQFADAVNALCTDPSRAEAFGRAGRDRVTREFSWAAIAAQTVQLYRALM